MKNEEFSSADVTNRIVSHYGIAKARKCMVMYKANIPERYWNVDLQSFTSDDMDTSKYMIDIISDNTRWIAVSGESERTTQLIVHTLKEMMFSKKRQVYFLDFFDIMSRPMIKYDQSALNKILHELDLIDIVGICNIKDGEMYNGVDEIFSMFIRSLLNTQFKKQVILGLGYWENGEMSDYYPHLGQLVAEEHIFTQILNK